MVPRATFLPLLLALLLVPLTGCDDDAKESQTPMDVEEVKAQDLLDQDQPEPDLTEPDLTEPDLTEPDLTEPDLVEETQDGDSVDEEVVEPTCDDGVQNGDETATDCGGRCGATCELTESCLTSEDCASGYCDDVLYWCVPPYEYTDHPFTVIEGIQIAEGAGATYMNALLRDAEEFQAALGIAPPSELDFSTQWALFHSAGLHPVPGSFATLDKLEVELYGRGVRHHVTLTHPDDTCETLNYSVPTWTLVRFDQITDLQGSVDESVTRAPFSCTEGGSVEDDCSDDAPCATGHICTGLTFSDTGICKTVDQWGVFEDTQVDDIPDNGSTPLTRTLIAESLATVDIDVIVDVSLTHPNPGELLITLTNPSGNELMVWDNETAPEGDLTITRVPAGLSGDESVNGPWTLTILDDTPGNEGTLNGWSVEITSRYD